MENLSVDVAQLPSLRVQTQGHRWALMFPLASLSKYMKSCKQGGSCSYKEILEFLNTMQPSTMASFLGMCPEGVMISLLYKGTVAYVPPAWILAEKALCVSEV